jgi:nicotinate-nucleotide pyrophosphorylase (carboxylating)
MTARSFDPIAVALEEDVGQGDITSAFFVPATSHVAGQIVAREKAIIAGTKTSAEVFRRIDPAIKIKIVRGDGSPIAPGDTIIELRGLARSILRGERVALNFLQRLSGIATLTRKFVEAAGKGKILDTRKTTPGLRVLEKAAVVAGGGANHRFGLFDMVLVKDNHLVARSGLSGIAEAIRRVRKARPGVRIEVEADRLDQVREILEMGDVDLILLDNMKPAEMHKAVALGKMAGRSGRPARNLRARRVKFEASGGITLKNVRQIAATGVDYISVGALTHSASAINFSLEIKNVVS